MKNFLRALFYAYATGVIVLGGFAFGAAVLRDSPVRGTLFGSPGESYSNWDGQWYKSIAESGYRYSTTERSNAVFFPAYPLTGCLVSRLTGLGIDEALLLTSNVFLVGAFWLILEYISLRYGPDCDRIGGYALVALGTLPTALFYRVNYSESMFLFFVALALYQMERGVHSLLVAVVVGLATAVRPVGVALVLPFVMDLWGRGGRPGRKLMRIAMLSPVAVWGLMAFSAHLYDKFGDPIAFVTAQAAWARRPPEPLMDRVFHLLVFEPGWVTLLPGSSTYWYNNEYHHSLLFNMRIVDPVSFLATLGLVAAGAVRRWLTPREVAASAGLLLIAYVTNGYSTNMVSMARYSSAVMPIYLVMGRMLASVEPPAAAALIGVSGFFLGAFSAMFATWHVVI
ncbi:mannosyltransferase family protein [Paludisphaera mucosa]|uniref:Mannosyltransferase family protein n=1 Tax=Paludisphaera mucosa TaxID=3030827 RepID=A0ABT6FEN0_9BACT|nr:mannosyltransferase family protein [Paludisphaera mucosa]MDG3005999.1 mannosyltransferase family protein [Paludisphaera mucosa]